MKNIIIYFIALIVVLAFDYFCFAFIILDFNPLNWSLDNRSAFVFSIVSLTMLSFPTYGMIKNIGDF